MALFVMLLWRGIRVAMNARDGYGFLLALGITCWLGFQALMNMAVITSVIPFTGIPLPFLSYGGSSMAMSLIGVGILLSVSRDAALETRQQPSRPVKGRIVRETVDMRRRDRRPHLPRFGRRR
jgi:cell division protein FtsW